MKAQRGQASYPRLHSQETPDFLTHPQHLPGAFHHQENSLSDEYPHIPRTCNKEFPGPLREQKAGSLSWLMFICLCHRLLLNPVLNF